MYVCKWLLPVETMKVDQVLFRGQYLKNRGFTFIYKAKRQK